MRLREAFPYTTQPGEDQDGEGQVRAGGRVGGAELQVELSGGITPAKPTSGGIRMVASLSLSAM